MKALLAVAGGFLATTVIFASGALIAVWFLAAEPIDHAALDVNAARPWTVEPQRVTAGQTATGLSRVVAEIVPTANAAQPRSSKTSASETMQSVNETTTSALGHDADASAQSEVIAAHIEWCASRYRSYDASDNSYRSYSGSSRACNSPYSEMFAGDVSADVGAAQEAVYDPSDMTTGQEVYTRDEYGAAMVAADSDPYLSSDHVNYCFDRYRSYRPSDNTYQPYGGGPRQQCR